MGLCGRKTHANMQLRVDEWVRQNMQNKALSPLRRSAISTVAATLVIGLLSGNGAALAQKNTVHPSKQATETSPARSPDCHTPKVGSAERKAILDALRADVQDEYKMPVKFVIHDPERYNFRVAGAANDWAFVSAKYVQPDGAPMGKKYWTMVGDMSDDVQALLHRVKGKWKVVTAITAVTDVEWEDWPKKYHAPAAVIPPINR